MYILFGSSEIIDEIRLNQMNLCCYPVTPRSSLETFICQYWWQNTYFLEEGKQFLLLSCCMTGNHNIGMMHSGGR